MSRRQDGFKTHVAVEPDTGIITDYALTKAAGADIAEACPWARALFRLRPVPCKTPRSIGLT
jgi:hypothetical protein